MAEQWWFIIAFFGFIIGAFIYLYISINRPFDNFRRKKNEYRKNK